MNIIFILLLLHTIFYYINRNKSSGVLGCGLFAYIGSKENHTFSWDKFNYLGRDNDERGGDSIGRMVGNNIVKFVNNRKAKTTYEDFVIGNLNSAPSHIAMGHTRKASVGGISEEKAQPIVLDIPTGEGKFVMVHNGTIRNWTELATKYGISIIDKTDSMVLAEIIMTNGFDVLKEYVGAAALIIRDDRFPDTFFVFKGASKNYTTVQEERPLFYYTEGEESMYISSKEDGLYFIGGAGNDVVDFDTNTLYEIYEGHIISETPYDRSHMTQNIPYKATKNTYHRNYATYDTYDDEYYGDYRGMQHTVFSKLKIHQEDIGPTSFDDKITFARCRYWKGVKGKYEKVNGIIHISEHGFIKSAPEYGMAVKTKPYYFYQGVMVRDHDGYQQLVRELDLKKSSFHESNVHTRILSNYSLHPVCSLTVGQSIQDARWGAGKEISKYYTGVCAPLFSNKVYTFGNGDLKLVELREDRSVLTPSHTKTRTLTLPITYTANNKPVTPPVTDTPFKDSSAIEDAEEVEEVVEDPEVLTEINKCISALLLAIDGAKNDVEVMQVDSKAVENVVHNLDAIENILYDDTIFKTKQIEIQYEQF